MSANDGASFHRAKGDEASCQQYGNRQGFMTALLRLLFCGSGNRGAAACRDLAVCRLGRGGNCWSLSDQCASVVNQALQPVGCHVQCGIIHRALVSGSGYGTYRL